jgi:hypothetical protein
LFFSPNNLEQSFVWREALLAAIGEQFSDWVSRSDDVVGVSVGRREKDDIVQIWNLDYRYESEAIVCQKFRQLLPHVKFTATFYKRKNHMSKSALNLI